MKRLEKIVKKSLISIIVPVYNIEEYIGECIESIVNQSYSNMEIIIVNDGSTDTSGQICNEWKKKDTRICVINKQNGGLSDARNYGLKIATGEYICFVDGDDTIDLSYIQILYDSINKYKVDLVACNFYQNNIETGKLEYPKRFSDRVLCVDSNKYMELVYNNTYLATACIKMGKRKIYENIFFPVGKKHEDSFVIIDVIMNCDKIGIIPDCLYFYRQRKTSIMNNQDEDLFLDDFAWINYHIEVLSKLNLKKTLFEAKKLFCHNYIKNYKLLSDNNKKIVQEQYKKYYKDIIFCRYMSIKSRTKYLLLGNPILLKYRLHI